MEDIKRFTMDEVIQLLSENKGTELCFTHPSFCPGEYIYRDSSGALRCEDEGYLIDSEFWDIRRRYPHMLVNWTRTNIA